MTPIFMRIWLMKMHHAVRLGNRGGQLAQRLAHQTGLQARQAVAHFAFDFGARGQRRNRVDDENVDRAGTHQRVGDFKRLFAGIRLRDQEVLQVNAELAGIDRIKRVFSVDEGADATLLLGLCNASAAQASSYPSFPGRKFQ